MSAKANGPTVLPAVDTIQEEGFFRRLFACFRKKNIGANGRVVPSNAVNIINSLLTHYDVHLITILLRRNI